MAKVNTHLSGDKLEERACRVATPRHRGTSRQSRFWRVVILLNKELRQWHMPSNGSSNCSPVKKPRDPI